MTRGRRLRSRATFAVEAGPFGPPPLGRQPTNMPPSRAFFSTYGSADLRSNVFLMILVSRHDGAMGAQRGKQPARARHDDCEHMRGYATPRLGQGSRVRHAASIGGPDGNTQAGTLRISVETARSDRDAEGSRRTEHAYGGRLVFTREYARGGFDHALDGASSAEPTRCISGNRPKSSPGRRFPRPPSRSGGEGGVLQLRSEAGLALGSGRRGQCATAIHRKSFSSRALESAATRPVARSYPSVMRGLSPTRSASNGCTRRFSPSAPKNKAKKSFS